MFVCLCPYVLPDVFYMAALIFLACLGPAPVYMCAGSEHGLQIRSVLRPCFTEILAFTFTNIVLCSAGHNQTNHINRVGHTDIQMSLQAVPMGLETYQIFIPLPSLS